MPKRKKNAKAQHLFNLKPEEISLVDEGANGKRIIITKRRRQPMPNNRNVKAPKQRTAEQQVRKRLDAMAPAVRAKIEKGVDSLAARRAKIHKDLMSDDDEAPEVGAPLSDAAQAALKASARIMQPYADEITQGDLDYVGDMLGMQGEDAVEDSPPIDEDIDMAADDEDEEDKASDTKDGGDDIDMVADEEPPPADEEGVDDEAGDEDDDPGEMDDDDAENDDGAPTANIAIPSEPPPGVDDDDHAAAAAAAREAYASTLDASGYKVAKNRRVQKRAMRENMPTGQGIKAQLARIEKRLVRAEKVNKSLTERNQKLASDLAVERDSRLSRDYHAKAEAEFGHVGDPTKIAKTLRTVRENLGEEAAEEYEAVLKGAASRIQKQAEYGGNLFSEVGSSRPGNDANGEVKIESLAEEIIHKAVGNGKKASRSQVYRDVAKSKEGRKAYTEYRAKAGR